MEGGPLLYEKIFLMDIRYEIGQARSGAWTISRFAIKRAYRCVL